MAKSTKDIKALLAQMTLEEKVGQLVQFNTALLGKSTAEITGPAQKMGIDHDGLKYVGSTLNFHGVEEMIALQKTHLAEDRLGIPICFMMDVIHGYRTIYPLPIALGASFDPEVVKNAPEWPQKRQLRAVCTSILPPWSTTCAMRVGAALWSAAVRTPTSTA